MPILNFKFLRFYVLLQCFFSRNFIRYFGIFRGKQPRLTRNQDELLLMFRFCLENEVWAAVKLCLLLTNFAFAI
jgi:hypothetical protein